MDCSILLADGWTVVVVQESSNSIGHRRSSFVDRHTFWLDWFGHLCAKQIEWMTKVMSDTKRLNLEVQPECLRLNPISGFCMALGCKFSGILFIKKTPVQRCDWVVRERQSKRKYAIWTIQVYLDPHPCLSPMNIFRNGLSLFSCNPNVTRCVFVWDRNCVWKPFGCKHLVKGWLSLLSLSSFFLPLVIYIDCHR